MRIMNAVRLTPAVIRALVDLHRGRPIAMSCDLADFCTLKCPYCYWLASTSHQQLQLDQWVLAVDKQLASYHLIAGIGVGGEPTMRPDILMAIAVKFPIFWVVTNGMRVKMSMAGPEFNAWDVEDLPPNTGIILSLDDIREGHDRSRNHEGLYHEIWERFYQTHRSSRVLTSTTLHQGNKDAPQRLLKKWRHSGIRGMTFEFATPVGRLADPRFDLVGEDRNRVIDELLRLRRLYGGFMKNSPWGLEMQRPENLPAWVGEANCPTASLSIALDSLGRPKTPCVLGSNQANPKGMKPDCNACGCHVPTMFAGMKRLDSETWKSVLWSL